MPHSVYETDAIAPRTSHHKEASYHNIYILYVQAALSLAR